MVRLGIIGTGGMAEYQAKKFSEIEGCVLRSCKDHKADHAEDFARRHGIPSWHASLDALLEEGSCDALTCVVIDSRHRVLSEPVLRKRLPLFGEKPLARTLADCAALTTLAAEAAVPNFVNFSKRNAPAMRALKAALAAGEAGEVRSVEAEYLQSWVATAAWGDWMIVPRWKWRLLPELSTAGVVGDLGSHLVDAVLNLFGRLEPAGAPPPALLDLGGAMDAGRVARRELPAEFQWSGSGRRRGGYVPVEFEAVGRLGASWGGAPVRIKASWIDPEETESFRITVIGSRGRLELDLRRSRDAVRLVPLDGSATRDIRGSAFPSTYELFIVSVAEYIETGKTAAGDPAAPADLPTFAHAFAVQRTLDSLFPGVMPA
jgi:predicted dehydrogenase